MTIPRFTLVHEHFPGAPKEENEWTRSRLDAIRAVEPSLADSLQKQPSALRRTLLSSSLGGASDLGTAVLAVLPTLKGVLTDLERQPDVVKIGIWDLGARVARLAEVIEALNMVQGAFTFFVVEAAIPAGMISQPKRVIAWWFERELQKRIQDRLASAMGLLQRVHISVRATLKRACLRLWVIRGVIENNMIAEDFFLRAEVVREDLGLDYVVGITPSKIAWADATLAYFNRFAAAKGPLILASAYDVRRFAEKAERPFEAVVVGIAIAQLLESLNPDIYFHEKNTGCLFDLNENRENIVNSIKAARIDDECLERMLPPYRSEALNLIDALKKYTHTTE